MQTECYSPTGNKVCQSLLQSQVMLWSVFLSQHHRSDLLGAQQCCRTESYGRCGKLLYFLCFYLPNGFCIQWNFWPLWRGVTLKASSLGPPEHPIVHPPTPLQPCLPSQPALSLLLHTEPCRVCLRSGSLRFCSFLGHLSLTIPFNSAWL